MGCDIHIVAQKQNEAGQWGEITGSFSEGPSPFDWRSYGLFGFLAGVRNYSAVPPISEPRGLPDDYGQDPEEPWLGDHSHSWLSVDELAAFDYDRPLEDRRITVQLAPNFWSGSGLAEPGAGRMTTYREFLGPGFFGDLAELQRIGAGRIVFGFDS
jgi:hypothetical protein